MPFDVAFALSDTDRAAYVITLGTLAGNIFNWDTLEWTTPA